MSITLYDAVVPQYLQILGAVRGFLDKGLAHAGQAGIDPGELLETRLFEDMRPLRFQLESVAHHSAGALEGVRNGVFSPPQDQGPLDYAGLQALVAVAEAAVAAARRDELNARAGGEVAFRIGERSMPFTVESFLFSFSLPNFYFHAATAYDILRMKGAPLGKRDFLGQLRMQG